MVPDSFALQYYGDRRFLYVSKRLVQAIVLYAVEVSSLISTPLGLRSQG